MFKYTFSSKNFTITDAIRDRALQKIGRVEKLLPFDVDVTVKFSVNKQNNKIEVTLPLKRRILRAETTSTDMLSAMDKVADILEKQTVKYKTRIKNRYRKDASYKDELDYISVNASEPDANDDSPVVIDRTKHFPLKPMDSEEAVMEMEMLGHDFYVFRNGHTDTVNVVYKRGNGTYGLIQPEY